ncbi:TOTE conflict system archaeo-eukaryotic primase domain-containing protein [Candidatus Electrothrix sp.]|uniref:TOTE conflict system archaeo-eukaryotic primase domain-containing protein n=1 Tax=Candidatus Electrothrix sp. TaxID=2170559 RepID=UPI0040565CEF
MDAPSPVHSHSPPEAKIQLFRSLFRGREDVCPRRFTSKKTGRSGYQPACANEWVVGVCDKKKAHLGVRHTSGSGFEDVTHTSGSGFEDVKFIFQATFSSSLRGRINILGYCLLRSCISTKQFPKSVLCGIVKVPTRGHAHYYNFSIEGSIFFW